jgi:hypothetical protein
LELTNMFSSSLAYTVTTDNVQIAPNVIDTLRVGFKPFSAATWNGTLTIETNDQSRPSISISVTGQGILPLAQLSSTGLAFDSLEVGEVDSLELTIGNTGEVPLLAWGWTTGDKNFIVLSADDTLEIAAGESAAVTVRFAPQTSGEHSATLSFITDDAVPAATRQVDLSGYAAGDGVALRCDMTGDGRANIVDVMFFLLLARHDPSDERLDWNGDGGYTIADVVAMLNSIRNGTCPDLTTGLASAGESVHDVWLESLGVEDIGWLRDNLKHFGFTADERERALAALQNPGSGRASLPAAYSLAQNHPNPFNPSTSITFEVPDTDGGGVVSLKVYSISGRLVAALAEGFRSPGAHTVFWDGTDQSGRRVASGVYVYRLLAGGQACTRKMVLLK